MNQSNRFSTSLRVEEGVSARASPLFLGFVSETKTRFCHYIDYISIIQSLMTMNFFVKIQALLIPLSTTFYDRK